LRENRLEIENIDGPPSKTSTTVVVHYRVSPHRAQTGIAQPMKSEHSIVHANESPEEWARRVTGNLSGLLKEELAEYGGGEAFLRWVRGYDEEES
jgi:hypothetical protein